MEFSWHFWPKLEQLPSDLRSLYQYSTEGNILAKNRTSVLTSCLKGYVLGLAVENTLEDNFCICLVLLLCFSDF